MKWKRTPDTWPLSLHWENNHVVKSQRSVPAENHAAYQT